MPEQKNKIPKVLSRAEVDALLFVIKSPRDIAIIKLMLYGGCRVSEATNALTDNFDLDLKTLHIMGKGSKKRIIPLNDDLMLAHQTDDCGNPVNDNTMGCTNDSSATLPYFGVAGYYYSPHYRNGQWVGELYGGAGGRNADGYKRTDN